jgi:hypothetical protein
MTRDDVGSERLRRLFDYWQGKRVAGALPARATLDPVDIPDLLGSVALIDVLRDPLRFRFRLVGTEIVARLGTDLTGRSLDDHPWPEYRALLRHAYSSVVANGEPAVFHRERMMGGKLRQYEVLYLPLAADGATVDMLLVGVAY